ncbi:MAG: arylamine N-acetyltransferase [Planctomycetes bacterium]|nr:arylamine N-acetyltransferase [Planctomycetota bacterium]
MTVTDYLRRLELAEAPGLDAAALGLIHERHLVTVPFENLDVIAGRPGEFELAAFLDKLLRRRRGGICYELNAACHWFLGELGFAVSMREARVARDDGSWGLPWDHMVLVVRLPEGERLVDVGFGRGFLRPLDLAERDEIGERGHRFKLIEDGEGLILARYERSALGFAPLYRILPGERRLEDFLPGWRHHTSSPDSVITQGTICSIAAPDGRVTLRGEELLITRNGRQEAEAVVGDEARRAVLRRYFRIND